jgi:ribosomal protein S18 acetylase RimI-like enzyme
MQSTQTATVHVVVAQPEDTPAWLVLAAEVEPLFGPMVSEPSFLRSLARNIERGTAFCVRQADGPPGAPLLGGLLFSPHPPVYTIGWLAVTRRRRRRGIGRSLVEHALSLVETPAEVMVMTFGADNPAGVPARRFYKRLGFRPAEPAPTGPDGSARQIFRRTMN